MMEVSENQDQSRKDALKHLLLIDGSGYIFRAYYALPPLSNPENVPVNAIYGFCRMLSRLIKDQDADSVIVIFDAKRKTFRNDIYADYKANRSAPPEDLIPQFPLMRDAVRAFNLAQSEYEGYEADDLIATWAKKAKSAGVKVTIVSSDKDMMQLMKAGIELYDPAKNKYMSEQDVVERFGVMPEKIVEVQALAGDSSDNIPGVPGIGIKTAAQLIQEFGDLETLFVSLDQIKQPKRRQALEENTELALISRKLALLKADVPITQDLEFARKIPIDHKSLQAFFQQQGFSSLIKEYGFDDSTFQLKEKIKKNYVLVQTEEQLDLWLKKIKQQSFVAFDSETNSLDVVGAQLVGISLSVDIGEACYIPLAHRRQTMLEEPIKQLPLEKTLAILKPLLEDASILKIGHNLKYDHAILARYDVNIAPYDDTMLMSFCLDGGKHNHNMDDLCRLHFNHQSMSFKDVTGKGKNKKTFDFVDLQTACDYAAEDADMTLRLWHFFRDRLLSEGRKTIYEMVERPLVPVISAMERRGIKVERDILHDLSDRFSKRIEKIEEKIFDCCGENFNIASARQLGVVLFEKMGLPAPSKTASGQYATGSDILESLTKDYEITRYVLDWRHFSKLRSTYTSSLGQAINSETGRVHTHFMMTGAQTGRLSSSNPNLQNIPIRSEEGRAIRKAFRAKQGYKLVSLDYSQIELRLAVHIAGLDSLGKAMNEGRDVHSHTASEIFSMPIEDITAEHRRRAKAVNFGILYGISAFGLAKQLDCSQSLARSYMDAYFQRYSGIVDYMNEMKLFCKKRGYVETLFGRAIHLPGINDKNPARRHYAERQAINAPIQGTAADIIKRAMVRISKACDDGDIRALMLLQVHDELLFEVREEDLDKTLPMLSAIMQSSDRPFIKVSLPLEVSIGVGKDWDEAH